MSNSVLTKRYAKSIFELAQDANLLEKVEKDLLALSSCFEEVEVLKLFLENPSVSSKDQEAVMVKILDKIKAQDLTVKFVKLLIKNNRSFLIAKISQDYVGLFQAYNNEVVAEVISAKSLTKKQVEDLEKSLSDSLNKKVKAEISVDEEIIGGLVLKIGSKMFDASVLGKLKEIEVLAKKVISDI